MFYLLTSVLASGMVCWIFRETIITVPNAARFLYRKDQQALSSDINREVYYAINSEAKRLGIPVIGHLPVGLQLEDLYQSGQSQLAHIDSITHNLMNEFGGLSSANSKDFLAHIHQQADTIAANLKDRDIALASTVWLHHTRPQQDFELANFIKSIEIEYQNNHDEYSKEIIISQLSTLFKYADRFYGRQFINRKEISNNLLTI